MKNTIYQSMCVDQRKNRREFISDLGACSVLASGLLLGIPALGQDKKDGSSPKIPVPVTNIEDFMKVPKGPHALPGPFPGKVVQVTNPQSQQGDGFNSAVIEQMVLQAITALTGKNPKESFGLLFNRNDVVGIKVNPVGAPHISTRPEVVEAVIRWLTDSGLPPQNIIIWDRFSHMLDEAGFTPKRFPKVGIEALQTLGKDEIIWKDASGQHKSAAHFDLKTFYWVKDVLGTNVAGYKDEDQYLKQHVFLGEHSYVGKLVSQRLTKIINIPVFKNTGHGVSMATKNLGYGAICNTARLHKPLFFKVNTEVLACPAIRDKLVLNLTDGLRGQYDGGPMLNEQFLFPHHSLYLATDPFALDMICHRQLLSKRKEMGVAVNEHPQFTEYLHYAEKLGLGVADINKIQHLKLSA